MMRLGLMLERSREDECPLACPDSARRVLRVHDETVWYLGRPFLPRRAESCARFTPQILGSEDLQDLVFDPPRETSDEPLRVSRPEEPRGPLWDASGPHPLFGAGDLPGGVDQADVAERLRKVA
jgi:hypothetical protein